MTIDPSTLEMMAVAADERADMWQFCARFAARPSAEFVEELRDGRVIESITAATAWLGDSVDLGDLLRALGAFKNRSARFSLDDDLEQLDAEWLRLVRDDDVIAICIDELRQARKEAVAWRAGDDDEAKRGRAEQFRGLEGRLEQLARWCQRVDDGTHHLVVRVLVRVVAAHIGVESGRDLLGRLESGTKTLSFDFL